MNEGGGWWRSAEGSLLQAQIVDPKEVAKRQTADRINSTIERGVDEGLNQIGKGLGKFVKKKKGTAGSEAEETAAVEEDEETEESQRSSSAGQSGASAQPKLSITTQYDFVPGDRILFFDDFSQDEVGDFPAHWTSNGSGEVKTVNIASGKWFHMNGEDAVYCCGKKIDFPDNFIIEFDIIPDEEYTHGATLTLYGDNPKNRWN
ncbi:MAG TPA: hypothetical protein PK843_13955 [bacterium]|nr:hypothetical protein [bacterium]HPN35614.1 hypothetical protein [bacterium]